ALAAARGERDATVVDIRAAGEFLTPLARRCGPDLDRFRTELSLGAEPDALDPRAEAITLLTLHAAKGLEFDVVFLAGCEKGLLPLRLPGSAETNEGDVAEERRLLFVALTRARAKLLLSCAARRTPPPPPLRLRPGRRPIPVPVRHRPEALRSAHPVTPPQARGPPAPPPLTSD